MLLAFLLLWILHTLLLIIAKRQRDTCELSFGPHLAGGWRSSLGVKEWRFRALRVSLGLQCHKGLEGDSTGFSGLGF